MSPDLTEDRKAETPQTLLVVDDEVIIRTNIADYLRECGFRVIEAASADEAITVLKQPDYAVDAVLSDVEMPGLDGFGLAKWLRANRPDVKIILAGSPTQVAQQAGHLCEKGPELSKPYDHAIVLDRIRRLLAAKAG